MRLLSLDWKTRAVSERKVTILRNLEMNKLNALVLMENKVNLYPVHSLLVRNLAVGGLSDY